MSKPEKLQKDIRVSKILLYSTTRNSWTEVAPGGPFPLFCIQKLEGGPLEKTIVLQKTMPK